MTTFGELGLSASTLQALADVGYESPSPIQEQAIPELLGGRDVIGQAQTGTGKTAAFGLPMIEQVDPEVQEVQALVLTPTRELCIQVTQALRAYAATKGLDVVALFGGAPIRTQQAQLRGGGHIVVGTVGRVLDMISRHSLVLHDCRFVVLDEADEMLDLGFLEDVEKILSNTPSGRQTALFSATMPPPIRSLADRYMYDPVVVQVEAATLTIDTVEQFALEVETREKASRLVEVLRAERPDQAIVFVRTKIRCDQLHRTLRDGGMNVKALHGDMTQGSRDGVMLAFKAGRLPVLVATDVAARGLDITSVTHVINYDVPTSPDVYVHRIGRTGRVGRSGRAITFVEARQRRELEAIECHIGLSIDPWSPGATTAAAPVKAPPRRHSKPRVSRNGEGPWAKLIAGGGRAAGIGVADLVTAVTQASGLDGEAVRDVKLLERFALLSVPEGEAERVIEAVRDVQIAGRPLRLERAAG
ncbi:MAG TPA: DEAD/DEAH box helicase [Solirubrobacteraceae bacterium]|jgi:ATP-dependent RNA helicase DeaD|nr:DEAD/DEAH box helicase [Solirubrobacteraceae bacterium]